MPERSSRVGSARANEKLKHCVKPECKLPNRRRELALPSRRLCNPLSVIRRFPIDEFVMRCGGEPHMGRIRFL